MPADLTGALKNHQAATAAFEKFPPGHRPEHSEWITEATCPETRGKRLATTLAWLAAGKTRNWKCVDCSAAPLAFRTQKSPVETGLAGAHTAR